MRNPTIEGNRSDLIPLRAFGSSGPDCGVFVTWPSAVCHRCNLEYYAVFDRFGPSPPNLFPLGLGRRREKMAMMRGRASKVGWCLLLLVVAGPARAVPRVGLEQAFALYEACNYSAARAAFASLARDAAGDPDIEFHLGRLALWFDDCDEALSRLEKLAARTPGDARVFNALGDAYGLAAQKAPLLAKLGWARKCRTAYERAVELAPRNPAHRWSLLGFYLIAPRIAGGSRDSAYAQAAEIEKLDPANGRIAFATIHLAERNYDAAFALFESVLRINPDDFLANYHVGRCAAVSGERLDAGLSALRRCLKLTPPGGDGYPTQANVRSRMGDILAKQGRAAEAADSYAAAKLLNPDFNAAKTALRQ